MTLPGLEMATVLPAISNGTASPCLLAITPERTGSHPSVWCEGHPHQTLGCIETLGWSVVQRGVQAGPVAGALAGFDGAGLAVADEHHPADPRQLLALDHIAVGQLHQRAGGDIEAGLDDAVVAEADAHAGVGAEQAALADRDLLGPAARERAHDRSAPADVRAVTDDHALADAPLDHRRPERARVVVAEA